MTETCENHLCSIPVEPKTALTCLHCRTPLYCSRKCQAVDWVAHNCPNVIDAALKPNETLFVPYHFEDRMALEEIAELDVRDPIFQSYSVRHVNAEMNVIERVIPALVGDMAIGFTESNTVPPRGGNPEQDFDVKGASGYEIAIDFGMGVTTTVAGKIPYDMIYLGNEQNQVANALAGGAVSDYAGGSSKWTRGKTRLAGLSRRFKKASDAYVFWPGVDKIWERNIVVPMAGSVTFTLSVDKEEKTFVSGGYILQPGRSALRKSMSKLLKTHLEPKLRAASGLDSTKNMQILRGADAAGNVVIFTVLVDAYNYGRLVDIEYITPRGALTPEYVPYTQTTKEPIGTRFAVDTTNLEQVMGLNMGLEYAMRIDADLAAELDKPAGIIRKYARAKADDPSLAPSAEVNVAVATAVGTLFDNYQTVDRVMFRKGRKFFRGLWGSEQTLKDAKKFTTKEEFQNAFDNELDLAEQEQASFRSGQSFLDNAEALMSMARSKTRKHDKFSLVDTADRYRTLRKAQDEIKAAKKK
jgi:hypothetical protein